MCTTPPVEQLKDSEEAEAAEETKCKIGHDVARVRSAQQQQQQQEQKQQQTLRALVNHRDDVESGDSTEEEGYNNGNSSKPKEVNRDDSGSSSSEALDGRGRQSTTKKKSKRQPYVIVLPTRTNIKKCGFHRFSCIFSFEARSCGILALAANSGFRGKQVSDYGLSGVRRR
jgi:hypothetical protein